MNSKQEYAAKLCPLIMTSDAKQFLFLLKWTRNNIWKKYRNSVVLKPKQVYILSEMVLNKSFSGSVQSAPRLPGNFSDFSEFSLSLNKSNTKYFV